MIKDKLYIYKSLKIADKNTEGLLTRKKYDKFRKNNNRKDMPSSNYIIKHFIN